MAEVYRGTWVVAYREVLRFVRERSRVIASITFPLLFLAIFGAGFNNVIGQMAPGVNLIQFMYPGIIAMAVLTSALSAGLSVVTDREVGFLREILVAPLSRTGIVLGKAVGAAAVALLQALLLLFVAPLVGVDLDIGIVVRLVPIVVLLSLVLSGLGIIIGSFMRSQHGFQMVLQILVFPMVFLAGVFYPVDTLPVWMEILSKSNPVTYGVDAIRQVFLGSDPAAAGLGVTVFGHTMGLVEELAMVSVLGVVLIAGAAVAFSRQE
ncbi:MAG TPA: ABC transporter permease [Euzebyales bacterium]|nr:ABC transporter permease [Euzebyales bacterium]